MYIGIDFRLNWKTKTNQKPIFFVFIVTFIEHTEDVTVTCRCSWGIDKIPERRKKTFDSDQIVETRQKVVQVIRRVLDVTLNCHLQDWLHWFTCFSNKIGLFSFRHRDTNIDKHHCRWSNRKNSPNFHHNLNFFRTAAKKFVVNNWITSWTITPERLQWRKPLQYWYFKITKRMIQIWLTRSVSFLFSDLNYYDFDNNC